MRNRRCRRWTRTQPWLPMKKGRAGTVTHDYKRNGTIDLFAAMDVATGKVLYEHPDVSDAPLSRGSFLGGVVTVFFVGPHSSDDAVGEVALV